MIGWKMFMSMRWARLHVTNTSHKQQQSKGLLIPNLERLHQLSCLFLIEVFPLSNPSNYCKVLNQKHVDILTYGVVESPNFSTLTM